MTQRFARLLALLIALAGLAALALQTTLNLERDGNPLISFALLLRYFTIWTNCGGALLFAWLASGRTLSARLLLALATAYAVVALVYHGLLAADHHPVGLDWWTNLMFHTILPASAIGWWLAFAPRPPWRALPFVMLAPVVYTGFALLVGRATGFYPYFFLDQPRLGWVMLFAYLAGLAAVFVIIGGMLCALKLWATRRTPERLPA